MKQLLGFSVFVLTSLLLAPWHARADEIRIVRGSLAQPLNFVGQLDVQGTAGLRIQATLGDPSLGWENCDVLTCLPGDVISLHAFSSAPFDTFGQVTIHGQTYTFGSDNGASANFGFAGSIVLPEFTGTREATLSVPFTFSGSLQAPNRHEPNTSDVFELHGSGVATVYLVWDLYGSQGWVVTFVTYDFEPRGDVTQG
jgi:hypothetical protein